MSVTCQTTPRRRYRAPRFRLAVPALAAVLLLGAASAEGQDQYSYLATFGPTLGGALDGDPDGSANNLGFLGSFSWRTQPRTLVGIRLGSTDVGGDQVGALANPTLRYATVAGEYRFNELYYESGVFMGLGLYQLSGGGESEEGVGLTLGVTGEFPVNERFSVVLELSGHYADLDAASTHATLHAGLAYSF